jgi:hypothetical protein
MMGALYSCKKSQDTVTATPTPVETVKLQFRLGNISTVETPIEGKKTGDNTAAKDLYDSTIYAIDVRYTGYLPFAQGLFNQAGVVTLEVPKNSTFIINVGAIKKGTGAGLYWKDTTGSYQYFHKPFNRRLMNELEYSDKVVNTPWQLYPVFMIGVYNMSVRANAVTNDEEVFYYSELDTHFGTTTINVGDTAMSVNIPMKRVSFGLQYSAANFNEGTLIAEYGGVMKPQSFKPSDISNSMHIYTANAYRFTEDLGDETLHLTLKWQKADGSIIVVGQKDLSPKRNSLTTINVTIPGKTGIQPLIELSDTTFIGNEDINF